MSDEILDLQTHRAAWRRALELARAMAAPAGIDHDDTAYWDHELRAFDRAFAALPAADEIERLRSQLVKAKAAIAAGQYYIDRLNSAWMEKPVRDMDEARAAWLSSTVDAALTDD